uniref:Nuclear receptor coactivator 4 N-terminal domain-containing protein n=1 Tax=Monopterus albus TaxID=43700 RepID=A0A3Q3J944_MONAL
LCFLSRMPSAEVAASGLKQCQQAQDKLEDAINGVLKAEQQLRENAREVRSELQSCVSRQQEALRCREVWLLGQIELLEQVKTETLQQQLHQLHRLRGQFDVITHQLQSSNSSNDLNNQLTSCMEKLSSLSLTPEETPEMSFHADSRSLRQAITSFGSVTAQVTHTHTYTETQYSVVCLMPTRCSLYGLQLVGALSDWLLGSRPNSGTFTGYQSSKNPQDWLLSHKESKVREPRHQRHIWVFPRWQCVLKPFEDSWSPSDWLVESPRSAGDCSTCCQISRAVEIENLGQLKCLKSSPASSPTFPGPVTPPAVPQTCRANELCSTYSDCVCEDNCGREALSLWLLQQDGRDKNGVPVAKNATPTKKNTPPTLYHREQEQKVSATPLQTLTSSLSDWVASEEEKASKEEHSSQFKPLSSLSPFQSPLDPDLWVLQQNTPAPESGGPPSPVEEEDKWLLKKRSQAQEQLVLPSVCDLFSCMKVGGDKDKWLHTAPVQVSQSLVSRQASPAAVYIVNR